MFLPRVCRKLPLHSVEYDGNAACWPLLRAGRHPCPKPGTCCSRTVVLWRVTPRLSAAREAATHMRPACRATQARPPSAPPWPPCRRHVRGATSVVRPPAQVRVGAGGYATDYCLAGRYPYIGPGSHRDVLAISSRGSAHLCPSTDGRIVDTRRRMMGVQYSYDSR